MGNAATPRVIHALYEMAVDALPDALVSLGFNLSEAPGPDLLMIGVDDPQSASVAASGDGTQTMATLGTNRPRDHSGSVTCAALSWNGDNDQGAAMDAAYLTVAAVEDFLRSDPTLGIAVPGRSVCQITDDRLSLDTFVSDDFGAGAQALVIFTIAYQVRI